MSAEKNGGGKKARTTKLYNTIEVVDKEPKTEQLALAIDKVTCPICYSVILEPVTLPCHHNLCLHCFNIHIRETSICCPCCRRRLSIWHRKAVKENSVVNLKLKEEIEKQFPVEVAAQRVKLLGGQNEEDQVLDEFLADAGPFVRDAEFAKPGEIAKEFQNMLSIHLDDLKKEEESASEAFIEQCVTAEEVQLICKLEGNLKLGQGLKEENEECLYHLSSAISPKKLRSRTVKGVVPLKPQGSRKPRKYQRKNADFPIALEPRHQYNRIPTRMAPYIIEPSIISLSSFEELATADASGCIQQLEDSADQGPSIQGTEVENCQSELLALSPSPSSSNLRVRVDIFDVVRDDETSIAKLDDTVVISSLHQPEASSSYPIFPSLKPASAQFVNPAGQNSSQRPTSIKLLHQDAHEDEDLSDKENFGPKACVKASHETTTSATSLNPIFISQVMIHDHSDLMVGQESASGRSEKRKLEVADRKLALTLQKFGDSHHRLRRSRKCD